MKQANLRLLRNEEAIADLQVDTCSRNMHTEVKQTLQVLDNNLGASMAQFRKELEQTDVFVHSHAPCHTLNLIKDVLAPSFEGDRTFAESLKG